MASHTIKALKESGQSVWLDYLSRDLITSGELKRLVEQEGLTGVTSNPTIFQKAVEAADVYDRAIKEMTDSGMTDEKDIYSGLAMQDAGWAADVLMPVYMATGGRDGFVSIEVSPELAYNTDKTISEAKRLFETIGRRNVLVKVPATVAGLPAIELLTASGVNVNVTLLFSVARYEDVMEAYLRGLSRRAGLGRPIDGISSVASFFVSRVDTMVDRMLDERLMGPGSYAEKALIETFRGRAAVANSKIAYRKYRAVFTSEAFHRLRDKGANVQTLLWGSTGTKDSKYSDVKYVDELVAPGTINTMPPDTLAKFSDHGKVDVTINDDLPGELAVVEGLSGIGIDIGAVASALEKDGVAKFLESYNDLLAVVAKKRDKFTKRVA